MLTITCSYCTAELHRSKFRTYIAAPKVFDHIYTRLLRLLRDLATKYIFHVETPGFGCLSYKLLESSEDGNNLIKSRAFTILLIATFH